MATFYVSQKCLQKSRQKSPKKLV